MEPLLGWTVTRAISPEVYTGLLTGQYKLYGGVIRWAPGTPHAGQIVRHLLPVATQTVGGSVLNPMSGILGAVNSYQLHQLTGKVDALSTVTQQILQVAIGNMILSGLNLAVSAIGFAVLSQKLNRLEGRLNEIHKEVRAIRVLLELEERTRLAAALRDLINVTEISNPDHRHTMLFNSKNILAPVSLKYKELLAGADSLETAMAYEEYLCLTSLAHARCLAELGMLSVARSDLEETKVFWQEQARRVANDFLLGKYPERFLFSDFVRNVPVSVLVEWLDFAYGEEKGYTWIDQLRIRTRPWYRSHSQRYRDRGSNEVISSQEKIISRQRGRTRIDRMEVEKEQVIPAFQKLVTRNNVFEGYVAQYELLEANNVTPSAFEAQIAQLPAEATIDGFIILEPAKS